MEEGSPESSSFLFKKTGKDAYLNLCKPVLVLPVLLFLLGQFSVIAREHIDVRYGQLQLMKMLTDRPRMKKWSARNRFIDTWAASQFAGAAGHGKILWDNGALTNKTAEYVAESTKIAGRSIIRIRNNDTSDSPELMWAAFVFECFNIQNSIKHAEVNKAAFEGNLRREQFIEAKTRVEFDTMHKTATFFNSYVNPYAKAHNIVVHPALWYADQNDSYQAWIRKYTDPNYYPFNSYGAYYDSNIASIYRSKHQHKP